MANTGTKRRTAADDETSTSAPDAPTIEDATPEDVIAFCDDVDAGLVSFHGGPLEGRLGMVPNHRPAVYAPVIPTAPALHLRDVIPTVAIYRVDPDRPNRYVCVRVFGASA